MLINSDLKKFISLVDELRDVGLSSMVSLPRIIVTGTQSAGKSSLLENIVGIDFLPRGDGVCTRRPLELRLVKTPAQKMVALFEELPGKPIEDMSSLRGMIEALTDKVAGKKKGILDIPIILTIKGPELPDLTLVDLPGITRIPLQGSDQPENIEEITKNLTRKYMEDPSTVILVAIAANTDITTSDALQMARKIDVRGERTIGVLTKIDIVDRGVDIPKMIIGEDVPLVLGYFAIKSRSKADIIENKSVEIGLNEEREFFSTNLQFSNFSLQNRLGTDSLILSLQKIFETHARRQLPSIFSQVEEKYNVVDDEAKDLGDGLPLDESEKLSFIWNLIVEYCDSLKSCLQGKYSSSNTLGNMNSQLRKMLQSMYSEFTGKALVLKESEVKEVIQKLDGSSLPGFLSFEAFIHIITPFLENLRYPTTNVIEEINMELLGLCEDLEEKIIGIYPSIKLIVNERMSNYLGRVCEKTHKIVEEIFESEINYIFTCDQDYFTAAFNKLLKEKNSNEETDEKLILARAMISRIQEYYSLLLKNLSDTMPKLIGTYLINEFHENSHSILLECLIDIQEASKELMEDPYIAEKRARLLKEKAILSKAMLVLRREKGIVEILLNKRIDHQNSIHHSRGGTDHTHKEVKKKRSSVESKLAMKSEAMMEKSKADEKSRILNENKTSTTSSKPGFKVDFGGSKTTATSNQNSNTNIYLNTNQFPSPKPIVTGGKETAKPTANLFGGTETAENYTNRTIDSAVDKTFENEKFQEGLKKGAREGAIQAAGGPSNPLSALAGKGAEKIVSNSSVQNAMKDQAKKESKEKAKKNLFGLF